MIVKYSETNLPTAREMRETWCFGLPLATEAGTPMKDTDIQVFIDGAVSEMERRLGVFLKPTIIASNPEERGLVQGVDYEIEEPLYDYDRMAYRSWGYLQLRQRPLIKLTRLKMVLPNGLEIIDFMSRKEWIKLYNDSSQIHIVPYAGDPTIFSILGGSQSGFPFVTGALNANLPQMFSVDYVAGYRLGQIPHDVRNMVAKIAAIDILGIAGDAVLVGISSMSTSIDGISESLSLTASATSATYGAHIKQYKEEVDDFFDARKGAARTKERGITFTVL